MYQRFSSRFLPMAALACAAFGQTKPPLAASPTTSKISPAEAVKSADAAAEVLGLERAMEAAVVRGDVAYVESVSAPDLSFTHGDGWTTGGKPLLVDDRKSFLARVQNKQYNVRDLD